MFYCEPSLFTRATPNLRPGGSRQWRVRPPSPFLPASNHKTNVMMRWRSVVGFRRGPRLHSPCRTACQAVKLDMAQYWQPTTASYTGRISKGLILEAVAESPDQGAAGKISAFKKDAMADRAGHLRTGKG
jgi:hypothetical protein